MEKINIFMNFSLLIPLLISASPSGAGRNHDSPELKITSVINVTEGVKVKSADGVYEFESNKDYRIQGTVAGSGVLQRSFNGGPSQGFLFFEKTTEWSLDLPRLGEVLPTGPNNSIELLHSKGPKARLKINLVDKEPPFIQIPSPACTSARLLGGTVISGFVGDRSGVIKAIMVSVDGTLAYAIDTPGASPPTDSNKPSVPFTYVASGINDPGPHSFVFSVYDGALNFAIAPPIDCDVL